MKKSAFLIIAIVFGILISSCNFIAHKKAEKLFKKGIKFHEHAKYDEAINSFTKAIELSPDYAEAYNYRGLAYIYKRETDLAIRDYTKAIELNPEYIHAYINRGFAYGEKEEYNAAMNDLIKALELHYTSPIDSDILELLEFMEED